MVDFVLPIYGDSWWNVLSTWAALPAQDRAKALDATVAGALRFCEDEALRFPIIERGGGCLDAAIWVTLGP